MKHLETFESAHWGQPIELWMDMTTGKQATMLVFGRNGKLLWSGNSDGVSILVSELNAEGEDETACIFDGYSNGMDTWDNTLGDEPSFVFTEPEEFAGRNRSLLVYYGEWTGIHLLVDDKDNDQQLDLFLGIGDVIRLIPTLKAMVSDLMGGNENVDSL